MREDFIIKFLRAVKDIAIDMGKTWARIPYKGFRYDSSNMKGYSDRKQYVGFKNLERRGLIKIADKNNFTFTGEGRKWLQGSFLRYFKSKTSNWDNKWRVVIFDIPNELHMERIKFRRKIKSMGFVMLQKSVFVFPYPCNEEIGDVAGDLRVDKYVDIITAESVGFREKEFLKKFGL